MGAGNSCSTATDLSEDELIRLELNGKDKAVFAYDSVLWKIRSGYAVILYGSIGLVFAFVSTDEGSAPVQTFAVVSILIAGFSFFAFLLDYKFLESKLRVVQDRDRLIDLCIEHARQGPLGAPERAELQQLLHNSGESRKAVNWSDRSGRSVLWLLYGGTVAVGVLALCVMAVWPSTPEL
jgi:hypothetical protein